MNRLRNLILCAGLVLAPAQARAHAHLVRSEPSEGSRLKIAPSVIRLWFSESPELAMTFSELRDSSGKAYRLGAPAAVGTDGLGIVLMVNDSLPPGKYVFVWRTAASDGHPSHGKFSFAVLAATSAKVPLVKVPVIDSGNIPPPATPGVAAGATSDTDDAAASAPNSLARALLFLGLLVLIGTVTFSLFVVRRATGLGSGSREAMIARAALFGIAAATVVIAAAALRLVLESRMMSSMPDMAGMSGMSSRDMVMQTTWGLAFRIQIAAALVALVSFVLAARRVKLAWYAAGIAALVLAITPALSGHAAAAPRFTALMVASDWLHVLGAATWLGSLLCVMAIGIPLAMKQDGADRWTFVSSLVNEFSRLALVSVAVVLISGTFAAWMHISHLRDLWSTTYGVILLVKLALVAVTVAIGAFNFKRVQPQLSVELGTVRLRKSASIELATGFLILLVTGLLTGVSP